MSATAPSAANEKRRNAGTIAGHDTAAMMSAIPSGFKMLEPCD